MAFWLGFIAALIGLGAGNLPLTLFATCAPLSVAATINDLHQRMAMASCPGNTPGVHWSSGWRHP